jgi:predicted  nucleic acid-binding Zn-ribbon protein
MTDTEILEDLQKSISIAIQSSENQLDVLVKLGKNIDEIGRKMEDLERRLLVLENRMNQ